MDDDEAMRRFREVWTPEQIAVLERWGERMGDRSPNWRELKQLKAELNYKGRVRTEVHAVRVRQPPCKPQQRRRLRLPPTQG